MYIALILEITCTKLFELVNCVSWFPLKARSWLKAFRLVKVGKMNQGFPASADKVSLKSHKTWSQVSQHLQE